MPKKWIKNRDEVGLNDGRKILIQLIEAGLDAIDTEAVVDSAVTLEENILKIKDQEFDLSKYKNVYVIGFGKSSCLAASALDKIMGVSIKQGVAIGLQALQCEYIKTYGGTHPHPSVQNVELSEKIMDLSKLVTEDDLVITIVSGGGSALLCWPMKECEQANRLYQDFVKIGSDIKELNVVRKHISILKGGGLAKILYPATVVGLIFSDIPGNNFNLIASGPTYKDESTIVDAQKILDKYNLSGYELIETPKDDKYFDKVYNIPLVSNLSALAAMQQKSNELGLKSKIISSELYGSPEETVKQFTDAVEPGCVVLGAGEPKVVITRSGGSGGRCELIGMHMLPLLKENNYFAAIASDGLDNSDCAGVIEDNGTYKRTQQNNLDLIDYMQRFDSYNFYKQLGHELFFTGPTEANLSDFMILYCQ